MRTFRHLGNKVSDVNPSGVHVYFNDMAVADRNDRRDHGHNESQS